MRFIWQQIRNRYLHLVLPTLTEFRVTYAPVNQAKQTCELLRRIDALAARARFNA